MIRPVGPRYRPRHGRQRMRARPGWWIVLRYKVLYRDKSEGLAAGGNVTIQSLYRDKRAVWLASVSQYNRLYRDRRRLGCWGVSRHAQRYSNNMAATRHAAAHACAQRHGHDTAEGACDTTGVRFMTRHTACHDMVQCAHGLGTSCTQLGSIGCAPYAPNSVLTQDTVLSHCLDHCS